MDKTLFIQIIYGAACIQGLILTALLFYSKLNQPANRFLAAVLFLVSLHLFFAAFENRAFYMQYPHLGRVTWTFSSLYGPLIFLFVQAITHSLPRQWWKNLWLCVPFLVALGNVLPYYLMSASEKRAYYDDFEAAFRDNFSVVNQFVIISLVVFMIACLIYYQRMEKRVRHEYSSLDAVRIPWIRPFLGMAILASFIGFLGFYGRKFGLAHLTDLYDIRFLGVVALFYWLSIKVLMYPVSFGIIPQDEASPVDAGVSKKRTGGDAEKLVAAFNTIRDRLEREKMYINPGLTLTELSDRTGMARHLVSQAINTLYPGNFFDLINDYRVEEFIRQAGNPENSHLTLLGIAKNSGFNSKASFYAVFKKKTGKTPAEYLESQIKAK